MKCFKTNRSLERSKTQGNTRITRWDAQKVCICFHGVKPSILPVNVNIIANEEATHAFLLSLPIRFLF